MGTNWCASICCTFDATADDNLEGSKMTVSPEWVNRLPSNY